MLYNINIQRGLPFVKEISIYLSRIFKHQIIDLNKIKKTISNLNVSEDS